MKTYRCAAAVLFFLFLTLAAYSEGQSETGGPGPKKWSYGGPRAGCLPTGGSEEPGLVIVRVLKDSPAERAGIKRGDIILKVDETGIGSKDRLPDLIARHKPGDLITIEVLRRGPERGGPDPLELSVELGSNKEGTAFLGVRFTNIPFASMLRFPGMPGDRFHFFFRGPGFDFDFGPHHHRYGPLEHEEMKKNPKRRSAPD